MENESKICLGRTIILLTLFAQNYSWEKKIHISVRDEGLSVLALQALKKLKRNKVGEGGGGNWLDHQYYTPLYKKVIKKTENKSMETTP